MLASIDWAIIIAYNVLSLAVGIVMTRRAHRSTEEYFLAGRALPWWIAGTSMVATSFSCDTPLYVTKLVRTMGIYENWQWWCFGIGSLFSTFFLAPLWRRSKVLTDIELTQLRYGSGTEAKFLRGFRALWLALHHRLTTSIAQPDLLQMAPSHGTGTIFSADFWTPAFIGFMTYIAVTWWANVNSDGGGKVIQRQNSCKNEQHALLATLWYSLTNLAFRTWPWVLVALCSMLIYPTIADPEMAYPQLMMELLPFGLKGLLLASLLAAFMSTISTQLNWGASYLVHDFYRAFLNKDRTEKHYLWISKAATVVILACAALAAYLTTSVTEAFKFIIAFGAGTGPVYVLRWFWWRINAWSEISAMLVSSALTLILLSFPLNFGARLLIITFGSAVLWIVVTLATPPAPMAALAEFFRRTKPVGRWGPVRQWSRAHGPITPKSARIGSALLGWIWGMALVIGLTLGIGYTVLLKFLPAALWYVIAIVGGIGLWKTGFLKTKG
jgi:Na+/proline symporter